MDTLEGISDDVEKFSKGCELLLSALAQNTKFSETEKGMIAYYCEEIMSQTQTLRDELEKGTE